MLTPARSLSLAALILSCTSLQAAETRTLEFTDKSPAPLSFSEPVAEGNYLVTVTFGDVHRASTNCVKAESRRLMLESVVTDPGEFVTRSFTVNVRTPRISDSESVRLKDREKGVLHWDDQLNLEFNGAAPAVRQLKISPATNVTTVYLLGDSTVTDQPGEPWNSWGQMLTRFFNPQVAVANHAESGESLASSISARRVKKVLTSVKQGDYVMVQFGHNDMKNNRNNALASYRSNMVQLVKDVRQRGGTPVLVTSMERMRGVEQPTLGQYPQTVRDVAKETGAALIDLQASSRVLYRALGTNLPAAFQDGTHHNAYGSYLIAKCVVNGIREAKLPLADRLAKDFEPLDPGQPPLPSDFHVPASPNSSAQKPDGN